MGLKVMDFIGQCVGSFRQLPIELAAAETERLSREPPRALEVSPNFQAACDAVGANAMHQQLRTLILKENQGSSLTDNVRACCQFALVWDAYDACLAFDGVDMMFPHHDTVIVVKLLASLDSYSAFLSMMYELALEEQCTSPHAAGMVVLGSPTGSS